MTTVSGSRTAVLKVALDLLHGSRAVALMGPATRGRGIIFTLHRVRPFEHGRFAPNSNLEIEPEFLDVAIRLLRRRGYDLVPIGEARRRLLEGGSRPFAVFTLDDGFRDNREHAAPVFARHRCPYTIFVASDYADGRGVIWWLALERVIAERDAVTAMVGGKPRRFETGTFAGKHAAFEAVYWPWRRLPPSEQRETVQAFAALHGLDLEALCREEVMGWEELRALADDPLVTIGAHTASHPALARLCDRDAQREMLDGAARIEDALGIRPRHLAYPYGDRRSAGERDFALAAALGFETAVTTRPGVLWKRHAGRLTALPRVSLNGNFQKLSYLEVLLSGLPFVLHQIARRDWSLTSAPGGASTG